MDKRPEDLFVAAGLTSAEAKVYESLLSGAVFVHELIRKTGLKRPTVYYALERLLGRGLVSKTGKGRMTYACEPFSRFESFVREKRKELEHLLQETERLEQVFSLNKKTKTPHVSFVDDIVGIQRVLLDMVYVKEKMIHSIVPQQNFFWEIGESFVKKFVEERVNRGIRTRNIWEKRIEPPIFNRYYKDLSEVRIMPKAMQKSFFTAIFLFDNKVLYVAPKKESYALQVVSEEQKRTMQALFEQAWRASEPY